MKQYLYTLLGCLNKFFNCLFAPLWNYLFLIKGVHRFGRHEEKMSEVLGYGELYQDLKPLGLRTANFLNRKDPEHCYNAVQWGLIYSRDKLAEYEEILKKTS